MGGEGESDVDDRLGGRRGQKVEADRAARVTKIGADMAGIARDNDLAVVADDERDSLIVWY